MKSLGEFAHYILSHPTEFNKISKQRANFYKNLIEKKGGMKKNKREPEIPEGIEMTEMRPRRYSSISLNPRSSISSLTEFSSDEPRFSMSSSNSSNSLVSDRINELYNNGTGDGIPSPLF